MFKIFDKYQFKARVLPGIIALLPWVAAVLPWLPSTFDLVIAIYRFGLFTLSALVLSHISRRWGKSAEERLHNKWRVHPTAKFLRWSNNEFDDITKHKIHLQLSGHTGISAPTREEEKSNPEIANSIYRGYAELLRAHALSHRNEMAFTIVHEENIDYGFARNSFGLRYIFWLGIVIASISLFFAYQDDKFIIYALVLFFIACLNVSNTREKNVLKASDDYAIRLLRASLNLPVQSTTPPKALDPDP